MTRNIKPNRLKHCNQILKGSFILLLSFVLTGLVYSQDIAVSGTIVDRDGNPLPGASIVIKGTDQGIITDLDGNFTISVSDRATVLVVTFIGYLSEEVTVGDQTQIDITLLTDFQEMSEVVVIGYGTQKKSDLTGAVASVSADEIIAVPVARVDEALVGRAAGVNVTATSGMPGASRVIQIRGISSINGANPLVVIDGIPGGDMNRISPSDIQSIEVLKDAASAAIYGVSGGNGVIVITTKKGQIGKPKTTLNVYTGIQQLPNKIDMMNTRQWNQLYTAIAGEPFMQSEDSLNMNTDWQESVFETAPMMNIDLNTSGGSEKVRYSFGANYLTMDGMVKNTGYDKFLLSMNTISTVSKRITFDAIIRFSYDKTKGPSEWQYQNVYNNYTTMGAITMVPFLKPYDENGDWSISPVGGLNPYVGIDVRSDQYNKNIGVHGNFGLNLDLVKGLTFTSRISGTINNGESWNFQPEYYSWAEDNNPISRLDQNWRKDYSWTFQNYLSYYTTFAEKHSITAILGMEASNWWDYNIGGFRQEFASSNPDLLYFDNSLDNNTAAQKIGGSGKEASSQGYFGRLNYDFNSMFLAQLNVRRDGNSNFGPNFKWGTFYSGSAGFKFSELEAVKNTGFISFGKLRIGYGETGQFPVTSYWPYSSSILNTAVMNYAYDDQSLQTGLGPVQVPNPDLHWETVKTTNIGLDMGFMRNQLKVTVDLYNKVNNGMIMPQQQPSTAGTYILVPPGEQAELGTTGITSTYPLVNYGSVSNKGIETTIDYKKQIGEFIIGAGLNFTFQKNEITELATDSTIQGSVHDLAGVTISKVGQPIGTFRGYQFEDIFRDGDLMVFNDASNRYVFADQPYLVEDDGDTIYARPFAEPGDAKWVDVNGDGRWDVRDYTYLGSYIPKFTYGFSLNMEYKGIDLSMFWQGVAGNKVFNGVKRWTYDWQTLTNHASEFADRYHLPVEYDGEIIDPGNLESNLPDVGRASWAVPSTLYIESGAYLRLRNLTLGYTLPKAWTQKVGVGKFRIYVLGKNLVTFTKYTAYDPEVSNTDPKVAGIDIAGYPQSRMYTIGITLDF